MTIPKNKLENVDRALKDIDWIGLMEARMQMLAVTYFSQKSERASSLSPGGAPWEKEVQLSPLARLCLFKANEA